jgi:hypothetical protein
MIMEDLGTLGGMNANFKRNTQALSSFQGKVHEQQGDKM